MPACPAVRERLTPVVAVPTINALRSLQPLTTGVAPAGHA